MSRFLLICLIVMLITSCSVNPVTGQRDFTLLSVAEEVSIGEKNFAPARQAQGGDYYVDMELQRYVSDVGLKLAAVADNRQLPYEFRVLNNPVPNAWALPGGKIAINRGLLPFLRDEAQLAAVLAHEIVHTAARHSAIQITRGSMMQLGTSLLGARAEGSIYESYADLAVSLGSTAWMARYRRSDELEADLYGMRYMARAGYEPVAAVELQQTFLALAGKAETEESWFNALFSSHPPSPKRVSANQMTARGLVSGARYKNRFEHAMRNLRKDKRAYNAAQAAGRALSKKLPKNAIKLLDKAIAIQPSEAEFWRLKGNAWEQLNMVDNAERDYSSAIAKDANYYLNFLERGIFRYKQGEIAAGVSDIRLSHKLLPTAFSNYYLGQNALLSEDYQIAETYLRAAVNSTSTVRDKARASLESLLLEHKPEQFLKTALSRSDSGILQVYITNMGPVKLMVTNLQISITDNNFGQDRVIELKTTLVPKQTVRVETDIISGLSKWTSGQYRARVVSAVVMD